MSSIWGTPAPISLDVSDDWRKHGNAAQIHQVAVKGGGWYDREKALLEMFEWCNVHFGAHTEKWKNPRWSTNSNRSYYWFRDDRDFALFVMRWS